MKPPINLILRPASDGMFLRPPPTESEQRAEEAAFRAFIDRLLKEADGER